MRPSTISFGLASHWLRKWRELCQPIIESSKAKPKQTRNYFRHSIENRSKNKGLLKIKLHFALLSLLNFVSKVITLCGNEVITFCVERFLRCYYILCQLLHFECFSLRGLSSTTKATSTCKRKKKNIYTQKK